MSTVLVLLALSALVAAVVRQLEANHHRDRSAVANAPGVVALDRDAERVEHELAAAAPSSRAGRRPHAQPSRPAVRHVVRHA